MSMHTHGSIHIKATTRVSYHCEQSSGASSYLFGDLGGVNVYVTGTPEEIQELGARLMAAGLAQAIKRTEAQS